ncbi:MAG TPA: hypothetical protein VK498_10655, partial [Ferruginibacter sp.]|nr:hypothetical protein [Ferruginibacter sp.]
PGFNDPDRKKTGPAIQHFFPVTNYFLGQVTEIRSGGINPLKIITINNHPDSIWIKTEELLPAFSAFLDPVIDTTNLMSLFKETRFLDQTLDAYTFTYEPIEALPDSIKLQHWDVYIDPSKNTVRRIYMLKKDGDKTIHLTWQGNEWCKKVGISKEGEIEMEEIIKWKF